MFLKKAREELIKCNVLMLLAVFSISTAEAENVPTIKTVNVLTWWGYFNNPKLVEKVESQCHIKLSFDQYYSNDEFLRRYQQNRNIYDVAIFSSTNFDLVRKNLPDIPSSSLIKHAKNYNPIIRDHFLSMKYPANVAYFAHSLTGFLYNPKILSISNADSLEDIFKKAGNNKVIIMDDAVEINQLLGLDYGQLVRANNDNLVSLNLVNGVNGKSKVYIGNGIRQMYETNNLAFAISWSGEAMKRIQTTHVNYDFFIHPHLSYISTDLIAQTSDTKNAECAAYYLSDDKVLQLMENTNYYFSPYVSMKSVTDPHYKKIYQQFVYLLPRLSWINPVSKNDFERTNKSWDMVKLTLNK